MTRRTLLLAAAAVLLGFSPLPAQPGGQGAPAAVPVSQPSGPAVSLQPGDVLRVEIWQEREMSGEFLVDEAGRVTLPLLGERRVAGLALAELRTLLLRDYAMHLRNPAITITPLRRISVLGEVFKPGTYLLDPTTSLAGAVALAGGANPNGDIRRIRIVRGARVLLERGEAGASLATVGVQSGDQIYVDRRSWMDRNSGFLVSAVTSTVLSVVAAIIVNNNN